MVQNGRDKNTEHDNGCLVARSKRHGKELGLITHLGKNDKDAGRDECGHG
jgi:hypothetical protein